MSSPSSQRRPAVDAIAQQTGFSTDAVESMLQSLVRGGGRMAQFDHPEFGGPGQWMPGGMIMISDLSNRDLEQRVDRLCDALAELVDREPVGSSSAGQQAQSQMSGGLTTARDALDRTEDHLSTASSRDGASWYPAELGRPDASGTQNHTRYAWFSAAHRLVVDDGERVTVYDTGDHRIGGVSQQQGVQRSVTFASQHGTVALDRLPVVSVDGARQAARSANSAVTTTAMPTRPAPHQAPSEMPEPSGDGHAPAVAGGSDPFAALEKLAALRERGIVDDDEFRAKKAELLKRI